MPCTRSHRKSERDSGQAGEHERERAIDDRRSAIGLSLTAKARAAVEGTAHKSQVMTQRNGTVVRALPLRSAPITPGIGKRVYRRTDIVSVSKAQYLDYKNDL